MPSGALRGIVRGRLLTIMSIPAITTSPLPSNPASQPVEKLKVNGKNRAAIDAMVWQGLNRRDAAKTAGLTDHALYTALTKPHVKAYYLSQLDVLRTSERARNIHALVEVRDQLDNKMARVQAVKALEQISDDAPANGGGSALPGLQIVIVQGGSQSFKPVDDERGVEISTAYVRNSAHVP